MKRLRLSKEAQADIDAAWDYGEEHFGRERADELVDAFHEKFRLLLQWPDAGRRRDELALGLRSLPASTFVILYQVAGEVVEIVRVLQGARDIEKIVGKDE